MATNPRTPDPGNPIKRPTGGMRPEKPKSGVTGTTLALIVGALLLAAIIYFMPQSPKKVPSKPGATVPQQPVPGEVQLAGVKLIKAPVGGAVEVQGLMSNESQRTINGLAMDVIFHGSDGAVLETRQVEVQALKQQGDQFVPSDLTQNQLKPGETQPFRVTVDRAPQGWNQQVPELKIALVTSHP